MYLLVGCLLALEEWICLMQTIIEHSSRFVSLLARHHFVWGSRLVLSGEWLGLTCLVMDVFPRVVMMFGSCLDDDVYVEYVSCAYADN